jgi:sulfoxide reductase catalytic subunit YedY
MKKKAYFDPSIPSSEITPKSLYQSRRLFLKSLGLSMAGAILASCTPRRSQIPEETDETRLPTTEFQDEFGNPATSFDAITNYNNYYEFSLSKERVASVSEDFKISPWQVEITGLVKKLRVFGIDELYRLFPDEERVYRMRCVEGWSMVIPWLGFPLASILNEIEPTGDAKFVRFETVYRPEEMPGQRDSTFPWPYQEGLRLDEALNDLTILSTGLYGEHLLPQNGAPLRLVVPWKYGFKSIKSIVKIELVKDQPATLWNTIAPNEYGFYSNVNPYHDHPRWSQANERRIGEMERRETLMFNGYAEQVAPLYAGMDLDVFF